MLSGTLSRHHEIRIIDGMIEGWTADAIVENIQSFQPDIIIFLTGVVSFKQDFAFITSLKADLSFLALASGELFLDDPVTQLKAFPVLDGAILDFTSESILTLIDRRDSGNKLPPGEPITNIVYRAESGEVIGTDAVRGKGDWFEIAIPRHEMFPNKDYRYPFVRRFPFATVLTDFGCPFHCSFCAIGRLGYKKRTVKNVLDELDLIKSLGFKDIYFDDQTFAADKKRTAELLEAMIARKYNLGFICFTRADVMDQEFLALMKKAGCHTLVFGVESESDEALEKVGKGMTVSRVRQAISWCRELGIRTVGTFIVGLPGMTRKEAESLGRFAVSLNLDFASFNVPVPRPGTGLRELAIEAGWIDSELKQMDQSGSYAVMGNEHISAADVLKLRNDASREFYLRPGYLVKRLFGIRTLYEFKSHLREMLNLVHPKRFTSKH